MQGGQQRGPINGLDPLIYTGGLPNLVVMTRRPNPTDAIGFKIGHWWIIPKKLSSAPAFDPSQEVWLLIGISNNLADWVMVNGSSVGSGFVINQIYIDTPGSGTYTPTSGMLQCYVECIGGGGAASTSVSDGTYAWGIVGGSGGYCAKLYSAADIGSSVAYVVGTGGLADRTAGSHDGGSGTSTTFLGMTAAGGAGGSNTIPANSTNLGGAGGVASGGDLNIDGFGGFSQDNYFPGGAPSNFLSDSQSGRSFYSRGVYSTYGTTTTTGGDGIKGAGGGSATIQAAVGQSLGGHGGNGLIIITEYIG